jgi:hypothetical protein
LYWIFSINLEVGNANIQSTALMKEYLQSTKRKILPTSNSEIILKNNFYSKNNFQKWRQNKDISDLTKANRTHPYSITCCKEKMSFRQKANDPRWKIWIHANERRPPETRCFYVLILGLMWVHHLRLATFPRWWPLTTEAALPMGACKVGCFPYPGSQWPMTDCNGVTKAPSRWDRFSVTMYPLEEPPLSVSESALKKSCAYEPLS